MLEVPFKVSTYLKLYFVYVLQAGLTLRYSTYMTLVAEAVEQLITVLVILI